jgi:hypothetical protein
MFLLGIYSYRISRQARIERGVTRIGASRIPSCTILVPDPVTAEKAAKKKGATRAPQLPSEKGRN